MSIDLTERGRTAANARWLAVRAVGVDPAASALRSILQSKLKLQKKPANMIRDSAGLYYHPARCGCGAAVFPRVTEELPIRCSPCRAERVRQIIAARTSDV